MAAPTIVPPPASHDPKHPLIQSIKELVDSGLQHVPPNYIRPPHDRPCASEVLHMEHIPVVDLSDLLGDGRASVIKDIGRACKEWGFFQVINHGVPQPVRDRMWKAAYQFFDMPAEERMRFYSQDLRDSVVYVTSFNPSKETVLEWKDTFTFKRSPDIEFDGFKRTPVWLREPVLEFLDQMRVLAGNICAAIWESLGVDAGSFEKEVPRMLVEVVGINYYPPCPNPDLTFGLSGHSDFGMLTLLMQDEVAGLQVLRGDGSWVTVEPMAGSFVVNVADLMEILTNGKYKSVEHRALTNAEKPRMSIPCFFSPQEGARVGPLARFVNGENRALYKTTMFGDYLKNACSKGLNGKSNLDFARA